MDYKLSESEYEPSSGHDSDTYSSSSSDNDEELYEDERLNVGSRNIVNNVDLVIESVVFWGRVV